MFRISKRRCGRLTIALSAAAGAAIVAAFIVLQRHRSSMDLQRGIDAYGHHWTGARTPRVVVHEYVDYACPHCVVTANRMARVVAEHPDVLRVVRHDYPRMRCARIPPFSHCKYVRAALCAGDQGKFWQMDAWLFASVKESLDLDLARGAREVGLDEAKLRECMTTPETFERADRESRDALNAGITATPTYVIDGEKYAGSAVFAALEARL